MAEPETTSRLNRARQALAAADIDALLLTPGPDLRYLTGLGDVHAGERLLALMLLREGGGRWLCPAMNREQVEACLGAVTDLRLWTDATWYQAPLKQAAADLALAGKTVAVDEEMRAAFLLDFQAACPTAKPVGAGRVMRDLRIRKDAAEVARLKRAGALADAVIRPAREFCVPGRTEREVAEGIERELTVRAPEFDPGFCIVASGPNGALPHHDTGERVLNEGEVVVIDYGGHLDGYVCDITITAPVGFAADPEVEKVYRVVWEAQQRALEAVRPGVACEAIDRAARAHIEAAGYGDQFLHRTGHGVGLQIHEPPYLVAGNAELLEAGMCFSVEPGIYLPGRFGVRLEVLAACGRDGADLLNAPSARTLAGSG
jgi:Xaa-Pro aminopeptidase